MMSDHSPIHVQRRLREDVLGKLGPQEQGERRRRATLKGPRTEPEWAQFAARILEEIMLLSESLELETHDEASLAGG